MTTMNTLIEIYNGANLGYNQRQYFIDCQSCAYANYRQYANIGLNQPTSCPTCASKWDGCGFCNGYGAQCVRCLPSHVFQVYNYKEPCMPCSNYMAGCIWCRSPTDCVKYKDKSPALALI